MAINKLPYACHVPHLDEVAPHDTRDAPRATSDKRRCLVLTLMEFLELYHGASTGWSGRNLCNHLESEQGKKKCCYSFRLYCRELPNGLREGKGARASCIVVDGRV